jgi:hypothetical protein
MFDNLITSEFKAVFNNAIDTLIGQNGLSVPCRLGYSGESSNTVFCNNCNYDPISKLSANTYKSGGPVTFTNGHICPVCVGMGSVKTDSSEIIYMAVLFDSKYFINWSTDSANIPGGMVQTICLLTALPKIRNANEITIDTNIENYGNYTYYRAGDPCPVGLGDHRYITTLWKRQ